MKMNAEKLVEYVRDFPLLYNIDEKDYSDNDKKELAWNEIGRLMNKSAKDCKKQWYNLRDCYRRAIKKRRDTRSGQVSMKIKKWKFEDEMSFLLPYFQERETISVNVDLSDNSNIGETEKCRPQSSTENDVSNLNKPSLTPTNSRTFRKNILTEKVPASRKMLRRQTASAIMMQYISDNKKNMKGSLDDIDHIFQGLAATVRRFSPYNQALAKAKVVSLVSDLQIKDIQDNRNESSHGLNTPGTPHSMMTQNTKANLQEVREAEKEDRPTEPILQHRSSSSIGLEIQ